MRRTSRQTPATSPPPHTAAAKPAICVPSPSTIVPLYSCPCVPRRYSFHNFIPTLPRRFARAQRHHSPLLLQANLLASRRHVAYSLRKCKLYSRQQANFSMTGEFSRKFAGIHRQGAADALASHPAAWGGGGWKFRRSHHENIIHQRQIERSEQESITAQRMCQSHILVHR